MKVTWLLHMHGSGAAVGGRTLLLLRAVKRSRQSPVLSAAARTTTSAFGSPVRAQKRKSPRRLRQSTRRKSHISKNNLSGFNPTTAATGSSVLSLADFHPAIARTWIAAASNKMLQPQHVSPGSRKLAWWICPSCQHQFNKRIDLHLAAGGECPRCKAKPSLNPAPSPPARRKRKQQKHGGSVSANNNNDTPTLPAQPLTAAVAVIAHKCRPKSSQATLAAGNSNMLSKSVADEQYLRVQEKRNLLPMLAKNFDSEKAKIGAEEVISVSPKLDGIRCVVAYRTDTQQVLFFSRSGTLFECCDDMIEPAVRRLFEVDPTLVLDGELYNDSVNLAQLATLQDTKKADGTAGLGGAANDATSAFYATLSAATDKKVSSTSKGAHKKTNVGAASSDPTTASTIEPVVIRFEQLTSAIRTTRQHLTPAVAALQRQLQYHVFDVLYAREFPNGSAATVPFSVRYAFLEKLLAEATKYNMTHIPNYNSLVLRRVPSYKCTLDTVDEVLRAAMRVGYEGIMIRREGKANQNRKTQKTSSSSSALQPAKAKLKQAAASAAVMNAATDASGGYGYGQRSSTLLKYKVMQDAEYVIVGAVEGSGKWKGSLGSFICVTADQSQRFTVTPASTDAEKKRMWRTWKQAYKGKALTVQYQELTPDGVPRFPVGKCVRGAADGHDWL